MIRRTFKGFIQLLGGLGAGLAIMVMVVAWQLSSGPISLAFLSPYIENAINAQHRNFKLTLKDTILTWAGWDRTLDIRVLGVTVRRPGGALVGSVPEVSFSLSGKALLGGQLAPRSIEMFGPRLRVVRGTGGAFDVAFMDTDAPSTDFAARLVNQLLAAPDPDNAMSFLTRLEIVSADVTLDDRLLRKSWVAPNTNFRLRRDAVGLVGDIDLEIDVDGHRKKISIAGGYQTAGRRFDLAVNFSDVSPAAFSTMYYELGPLHAFRLPLAGTVTVGMSLDGKVEAASFKLTGGRGQIDLPEPLANAVPVEKMALEGRYHGDDNRIDIDSFRLDLARDGYVSLPPPADHRMPLSSVRLTGTYSGDTHRLMVKDAVADLGGPMLDFELVVDGLTGLGGPGGQGEISMDVAGTLRDVPIDELKRYWPAAWGRDAHRWTTTHLRDGVIRQARAEVRLWSGGGRFELVSLDGDMDVTGVTVDYLPPMPPVGGVDAHMKYDDRRFDIFVASGATEGLTVTDGTILLSGLDAVDQYADITLQIDGAFPAKLAYMDHAPLRYASALGIDPASTQGDAETELRLRFIMENDLTLDEIDLTADATVKNVGMAKAVLGRDIDDGALRIAVDKKGMDVAGDIKVGKVPAALVWRENFGPKPQFRRRYDLTGRIADTRDLTDFGLDVAPFTDKYVNGALDVNARFTVLNDTDRRLEIKTDIAAAELLAPAFGWRKRAGVPGQARITVDFKGERVSAVPAFEIVADDLNIAGRATYGPGAPGGADGAGLRRIDFERVSYGRTKLRGALIARPGGGWDAGFHGASFDISAMWNDILHGDDGDAADDGFQLPYVTIAVELQRVWIGPDRKLENVSGTFAHKDDLWRTVLLKGEIDVTKSFELTIRPDAEGNRRFVMTSEDAGETLRAMDYFSTMKGGRLEIVGKYNDAAPGRPLVGTLRVGGYRITKAPLMARVLSVMALTGILEALQGEGLAFDDLEIPFELGNGWLEVKNAKATGKSLGFTASGTVYTYADVIDINGTVVPAYAINSALGRLPVLGGIFTGGEEGGGVFAANYSMSGPAADPEVTVNPLSALTPGIFRNVFDIFGQLDGKKTGEHGSLQ